MTKKDLERRNKFLLLQLKIIAQLANDDTSDRDQLMKNIGHITYYTDPDRINEKIRFIEEHDLDYNFYEKKHGYRRI